MFDPGWHSIVTLLAVVHRQQTTSWTFPTAFCMQECYLVKQGGVGMLPGKERLSDNNCAKLAMLCSNQVPVSALLAALQSCAPRWLCKCHASAWQVYNKYVVRTWLLASAVAVNILTAGLCQQDVVSEV